VATSASTRSILRRAIRWYDIRLFIWAYSRGYVIAIDADQNNGRRSTKMLADMPSSVIFKVLPFLTDVHTALI
jgi:hypothetical protein